MDVTLSQIKSKVEKMAKIIGASGGMLPTFGNSEQSGRPHIEVDSNGYHYVIAERGRELERRTTLDVDELLYQVFQFITFVLAGKYELGHRIHGRDARRLMFEKQEEMLSQLSPAWGERSKQEHAQILQSHPFNDV